MQKRALPRFFSDFDCQIKLSPETFHENKTNTNKNQKTSHKLILHPFQISDAAFQVWSSYVTHPCGISCLERSVRRKGGHFLGVAVQVRIRPGFWKLILQRMSGFLQSVEGCKAVVKQFAL